MIDFSKKFRLSDKRILEIVKKEVDKLLVNEEYSISDTVMACARDICSSIEKMYMDNLYDYCHSAKILVKTEDETYRISETMIKEFNLRITDEIKNKIPKLVSVTVFVIELGDVDTYKINYENIDIGGSYSLDGHTITIHTVAFDGGIRARMLYQSLLHELEHAYQYSLANQTDYKHLLGIANKRMSDNNPIISSTARLLYFFNPREIDANIQSFYDDLNFISPKHIDDIKQTEIISERNAHIDKFYSYLKSLPKGTVNEVIKPIFHIDIDFLFSYIDRQIKYLNKKIMRVYYLYTQKNKMGDIILKNEGKVFHIR